MPLDIKVRASDLDLTKIHIITRTHTPAQSIPFGRVKGLISVISINLFLTFFKEKIILICLQSNIWELSLYMVIDLMAQTINLFEG